MDPSRFDSMERNIRLLKTWSVILTTLVLLSLTANAVWVQAATDPPIHVFTAPSDDHGGGGNASTEDFVITPEFTSDSPLTLVSVVTNNLKNGHNHTCLVTASAQVFKPNNTDVSAAVVLGLSTGEDSRILSETNRLAHIVVTPDEDSEIVEVSTTFAFTGVRRGRTFRFSAYWNTYAGSTGILAVGKPSMTAVCLKHQI